MTTMIQLNNITKTHQRGATDVHALRGVSFGIAAESFNLILGPSGSGKSSLLYLIGALDEPTNGTVVIGDRDVAEFSAQERDEFRRNEIGFIFQSFNLLSNLDAIDNVLIPYFPVGIDSSLRKRAVDLLKQVGLGNRLDHRPHQLSGGEQQRVAIARALLKQPSLVLADEPTGELDSENGAEVFEYLRLLRREHGTTVVVVTHDQSYAADGDTIIRLRDGQLAQGEE